MAGRVQRAGAMVAVIAGLATVILTACQPTDLRKLASDEMGGRASLSPGNALARAYIVERLKPNAEGANTAATGDAAYLQPFATGTNVVAVIPGTDLADEYVLIGAHYDHLASINCPSAVAADQICNGATDNASGVSAVLNVADTLAADPPRRSVILALWDAEERGRVGSKYYADNPLIPLADTVSTVNVDIQGSRLLPSLKNDTFAVAAETGGAPLTQVVTAAAQRSPLDVRLLSNVFGAGRSDHASFTAKQIPTVFLTDSAAGCYHSAQDGVEIVDWGKLERQRKMLLDIVGQLANMAVAPTFVPNTPQATFDDVRTFKRVVDRSRADIGIHSPSDQARALYILRDVTEVFDDGPAKFTAANRSKFLSAALQSNGILENDPCNGGYVGGH